MLEKVMKRNCTINIIISCIFIVIGGLIVSDPGSVISVVSYILTGIFGVISLVKFVSFMASNYQDRGSLFLSIISLIGAILFLFWTGAVFSLFRIIIGIWIIYNGAMRLKTIVEWKNFSSLACVISFVIALVLIILGAYIVVTSTIIIKTIGTIILVYSILDVIQNIIFLFKFNEITK